MQVIRRIYNSGERGYKLPVSYKSCGILFGYQSPTQITVYKKGKRLFIADHVHTEALQNDGWQRVKESNVLPTDRKKPWLLYTHIPPEWVVMHCPGQIAKLDYKKIGIEVVEYKPRENDGKVYCI
ncbi:MAG: hypothetical protein B6I30_09520 [Desulfobacteraceae bacterium 4572_187]|nr:MAG: hypothetical protein B6I30_09520 [Desulfobacteraceae bacterium 4572_187]